MWNFLERDAVDHDNLACQPRRSDSLKTGPHAGPDLDFQVLDTPAIGVRAGYIHIDAPHGGD
jgi:hypothetical protein